MVLQIAGHGLPDHSALGQVQREVVTLTDLNDPSAHFRGYGCGEGEGNVVHVSCQSHRRCHLHRVRLMRLEHRVHLNNRGMDRDAE